MNGKGSKRRKGSDDVAYRQNWEKIFGKTNNSKKENKDNEKKAN